MSTRRRFLAGVLALGLPQRAGAEPVQGDDGLYHQSWFLESFLDLPDDLKAATRAQQAPRRALGAEGVPLL